jgi:hypothetical protein
MIMLTKILMASALAASLAFAQDSIGAGTYKGKWSGGGGDGDFKLTLAPDGKGGLRGEVVFAMAGQEVPCKTTSLKIDGSSMKIVYEFDMQGNKLQSAVEGKLKGKTLEGTYKTTLPGGDEAVDQGTWKASSGG